MALEASEDRRLIEQISNYWNEHIHDQHISRHPPGSSAFFEDLHEYRFDKLRYLPQMVDFRAFAGKQVLEVGCGAGIDLKQFAESGASVTGIDMSRRSIELARCNFSLCGLRGQFCEMNGERLGFADGQFDLVYAHGVLQYTADPETMVREIHRVLRPNGKAILMVYNRHSWLLALSKLMNVAIEHKDAPAFRLYSIGEFRRLLRPFSTTRIIPERFPVATRLHRGLKATLYNGFFVKAFDILPRAILRPFGWHLMAFATKK